jgi:hypothetical protein
MVKSISPTMTTSGILNIIIPGSEKLLTIRIKRLIQSALLLREDWVMWLVDMFSLRRR